MESVMSAWVMVLLLGVFLLPPCASGGGLRGEVQTVLSVPGTPGFPGSKRAISTVNVHTCTELRDAFKDENVRKVVVAEDVVCTRRTWSPDPVVIRRNVDVVGLRLQGASWNRPMSIDWSDTSKVIIVERGAVVLFHELLMYQDDMGIGGLNMPFIQTRQGATGVFTGMVVVVRSCLVQVSLYDQLARLVPRPDFLKGKQTMMVLDDKSLLVDDMAVWWPNINSLWCLCNTAFVCGHTSPTSHRVTRHFDNMEALSKCETGEKLQKKKRGML